MKKYLSFLSLYIFSFCFSQQTEGLRMIKAKYDIEIKNVQNTYNTLISKKISKQQLNELLLKKDSNIRTLEFKRNNEYLEELPKIKLSKSNYNVDIASVKKLDEKGEVVAKPPKDVAAFKKELADNFYGDNITAKGSISCDITFITEKDGSIKEVKAIGDNETFNKQAELAVYLSEGTWEPARMDGYPVRYRFRIPLTMRFE